MTDIVERLRDRDAIVFLGLVHAVPAMREAAAEIETLRAKIAHMEMHLVAASDVDAERDRYAAIVQRARFGEIDQDFRRHHSPHREPHSSG